ncbi:hypothetical protein, partial [Bradyrhizobium sp.]|uniref:hypothetical protein n=1 Tax=Bradyrhizobium sp. TaxID=376 RepID=UPI0025C1EE78
EGSDKTTRPGRQRSSGGRQRTHVEGVSGRESNLALARERYPVQMTDDRPSFGTGLIEDGLEPWGSRDTATVTSSA